MNFLVLIQKQNSNVMPNFVLFCFRRASQVVKASGSMILRSTPIPRSFQFLALVRFLSFGGVWEVLFFQF